MGSVGDRVQLSQRSGPACPELPPKAAESAKVMLFCYAIYVVRLACAGRAM
ncbi:hypothetical protein LAH08_04684 [Micromonospora noduli]|uniref:Uncharacterized protein n=1 Tax=Micromonospora noduli TaxID=709876 RepID=A0A328N4Y5_9ACTN|nr:hypothetical protein LAH08_04684 [Micromonospora noduli]